MSGRDINRPEVHAEVTAAVLRYEAALTGNDVTVLDELFWDSSHTVRYGAGETLYGRDEILAFRRARGSAGLERTVRRLVVTTFGDDVATANLEFVREGRPEIGRQSQTWIRFPEGWRVVSAHVSAMPEGKDGG